MNAPNGAGGVILLTPQQLRELVREAVAEALADHAPSELAVLDRLGLSKALGCSVSTIDRLRKEGAPFVSVGDVARFELPHVLQWLRERGR